MNLRKVKARGVGSLLGLITILLFSVPSFAQDFVVSGHVYGGQGSSNPLPGVNIRVLHTKSGVATDKNGYYQISVSSPNDTLRVSFVGYQTQKIPINGRKVLDINMRQKTLSANETVIVGYGRQKAENVTGSVESVQMDQINDMPVSNLSAALRGADRLTGVHINGGQDRPGAAGSIVVRNPPEGAKNGGDQGPLYVINGVVRSQQAFNLLDPNEVADISIVKGATAAIYGARAAQGVVLVETKKGQAGEPTISVNSSTSISDHTYLTPMMNGYQLANYLNDKMLSQGIDKTNSDYYTDDELAYFKKYNYDWFDMAWKPSFGTHQSLSISGGSDKATYFASGSYYRGNGNVNKIHYKKWNLRASGNVDITNHLKVGLDVSGNVSRRKWFFLKQGGENPEQDVTNLRQTPQFIPPYVGGKAVRLPGSLNRGHTLHFFAIQNLDNYTKSNTTILNANAHLQYSFPFLEGLELNLRYNRDYNNFWGKQYGTNYDMYQFDMAGSHNHIYAGSVTNVVNVKNGDRVRINPSYTDGHQFNADLSYHHQFGKHTVSGRVIMEQASSYDEQTAAQKGNVVINYPYMLAALGTETTTNSAHESGTLSYAGRARYNYDDTYIGEFDWRYDSSTKFAPEYRWGFFPALSAAWIISNEGFFNNDSFMNFLKVRASAGRLGRDRTSAWEWFQRYSVLPGGHGAIFGGNNDRTTAIKLEGLPNRFVTWDVIDEYDAGISSRMLDDRLSVDIEGYFNHGHDLLTNLAQSAPFTIGSQMPAENYSITNTMGWNITATWQDNIGKDFQYSITTGYGWQNSKIVKYDVAAGNLGTYQDLTGTYSRNRGTLGFVYKGMFRDQEQVDNYLQKHEDYTVFGKTPEPGMLYYKDVRGPQNSDGEYTEADGKITDADRQYIMPDRGYNQGFSFSMSWKGLHAHIKTHLSIGSEEVVPSDARGEATTELNKPAFWTDHWTPENKDATYPDPYYSDNYGPYSSFWFRDSSEFSISLISLSYSLPRPVLDVLGVDRLNMHINATNPFRIQNNRDQLTFQGNHYPTLRTVSFGINLNI